VARNEIVRYPPHHALPARYNRDGRVFGTKLLRKEKAPVEKSTGAVILPNRRSLLRCGLDNLLGRVRDVKRVERFI